MRIAVLTLTRDRFEYTKHCFKQLGLFAGCDYDHFILDQGSTDGTAEWLMDMQGAVIQFLDENVGISVGMNRLITTARGVNPEGYDVVVKFDNDCELTQPNTLRDICKLVIDGGALLSPRILGLRTPPPVIRELRIGDDVIQDIPQIGGIFLAAPAWAYDEFRYSESNPTWGGDDIEICAWWRRRGGTCGYVKRLEAWHYQTTDGQAQNHPGYMERKQKEMAG